VTAPIRVAIVGAGVIGANHASAVLRHPRLRIVALVDPMAAAGRELAARIAAQTGMEPPRQYGTLAEALAGDRTDLVVLCTPTGLHAGQAAQALDAGRHVVIEKPVDVSLRRARRLADLAAEGESRGLVATVISQHRFDPASRAVAAAVAGGRLGRITSAIASVPWWRSQRYYDSARWRGTWELDGGGALMNQGVHMVDLLLWLLGRPREVSAYTARLAHDRIEVEDVAVATLTFASGALAVLHATTAAYPGLGVRLQVHGSRGSAVIHDDQLEYFHAAGGDGADGQPAGATSPADGAAGTAPANQAPGQVPVTALRGAPKPPDDVVVGHLRQYDDVVEAIDGRRPPAVRVADGLLALAVVEAVYLSATLQRPIGVDDVLGGVFDGVPMAARGAGAGG
jgi:UDP-N-acetyl-2-amino-2-deoxyglucuronate dehydrogenase